MIIQSPNDTDRHAARSGPDKISVACMPNSASGVLASFRLRQCCPSCCCISLEPRFSRSNPNVQVHFNPLRLRRFCPPFRHILQLPISFARSTDARAPYQRAHSQCAEGMNICIIGADIYRLCCGCRHDILRSRPLLAIDGMDHSGHLLLSRSQMLIICGQRAVNAMEPLHLSA